MRKIPRVDLTIKIDNDVCFTATNQSRYMMGTANDEINNLAKKILKRALSSFSHKNKTLKPIDVIHRQVPC